MYSLTRPFRPTELYIPYIGGSGAGGMTTVAEQRWRVLRLSPGLSLSPLKFNELA